jgi:hypothetical protein
LLSGLLIGEEDEMKKPGYVFAALGAIAAPSIASAETVVIIKHRHDRYQEAIAKWRKGPFLFARLAMTGIDG